MDLRLVGCVDIDGLRFESKNIPDKVMPDILELSNIESELYELRIKIDTLQTRVNYLSRQHSIKKDSILSGIDTYTKTS